MFRTLFLPVAIVYTVVLVIASLINLSGVPRLGSSFDDKIYHFIAYLGLAFLWVTYFKLYQKKINLVIVFLCVILFGIVLEFMQHPLNPNRTYDTYDIIANCLGAMVGTLIAIRINIYKLK